MWFLKGGSRFKGNITNLEWKFQNNLFLKMQIHYSVKKAKNKTFGIIWKEYWDKLSNVKNTVLQTTFYLKSKIHIHIFKNLPFTCLFLICVFFWLHSMWYLSSPPRGGTCAPCSGSTQSWPLDVQGGSSDSYLLVCVTWSNLGRIQ